MGTGKKILPDISVIIPVYNADRYLKRCLNSVCRQTLHNIEIICVDDGSTDNSARILDEYARADKRIRIIHQKNSFAGTARNRGMKVAKGQYVAFLDADDYYLTNMLEVMLKKATKETADIVICNSKAYAKGKGCYHYASGELKRELLPKNKTVFSKEDIGNQLFQLTVAWPWDKLFRKEFIEQKKIYFQSLRSTNDAYFVNLALAEANVITYTLRHLVIHRQENQDSLENTRDKSVHCCWQMLYGLQESLIERGLYGKLEKTFINHALTFLVWSLISLKNPYSMEALFNELKKDVFSNLHIKDKPREFFYDEFSFQQFEYVMNSSFTEYLLQLLRTREKELEQAGKAWKISQKVMEKKVWCFPITKLPRNSKIIIYGAGDVGQDLYYQFTVTRYYEIIKWVDQDYKEYRKRHLPVEKMEGISQLLFDYIILGVLNKNTAEAIRHFLIGLGIPEEKIIWEDMDNKRKKVNLSREIMK